MVSARKYQAAVSHLIPCGLGVCSYDFSLGFYLPVTYSVTAITYFTHTLLHTLSSTSMRAPLSNKGLTVTAELRREAHISAVHPS